MVDNSLTAMSDSFSKAVDARASKLPSLVKYKGDTYPRIRIPTGSSAIESEPMWALTKEGWVKAVKVVGPAMLDTVDTAGAMIANIPAASRRFSEGATKVKDELLEDPSTYAKKKYNELKELGPAISGDPEVAAQIPADIALALATRTNPVQRALRLDETPLDEAAIASVAAEKLLGAGEDKSKQDPRWFPKTRDAIANLPADYGRSMDELIEAGEKDPRYADERELADQISKLMELIPGFDESDMDDPFEITEEKPKRNLVSQRK